MGAGVALGTLAYAYFGTHPPRKRLRKTPADRHLPYEDVSFCSQDGLRLAGWLIPPHPANDAGAVVVACHGYPSNRLEMLPHAELLHAAGFTVLLFDFRAMGESEGDLSSIGYHETADLLGALDYLDSRPDTTGLPIGAIGQSLGGAVAIMTAARDARLQAIVADASFPDLQDAMEARFRFLIGPLSKVAVVPIRLWAKRWLDFKPHHVSPRKEIANIGPRAVMLIQGQRDLLVRWQDAVQMFANAQEPRELWLLKNSNHSRCLRDEPEEYTRRVTAFFRQHLT